MERKTARRIAAAVNGIAGGVSLAALFAVLCACLYSLLKDPQSPARYAYTLLFLLGILAGLRLLMRSKHPRAAAALVFALGFALRLLLAFRVPSVQVSDFALLYEKARAAAAGDMSWARAESGYFFNWAYQIPYVLYEAAVLRAGGGEGGLKLLNALYMTASLAFVYGIAKECFHDERKALCAAFLYAVLPDGYSMASVLTNQHISTALLLGGICLFCRERGRLSSLAAGALLGLSGLMRPEAVIVLLAGVFACLWRLIAGDETKEEKRRAALGCALFCCGWLLIAKGAETLLLLTGAAPNGIGNNAPEWKFALGLDFSGSGSYSEKNLYILGIAEGAERRRETLRLIRASLRESGRPLVFFAKKIRLMWTGSMGTEVAASGLAPETALLPFVNLRRYGTLTECLTLAELPLLWGGALLSGIRFLKEREKRGSFRFLLLYMAGMVLVYLLIEAQARYRYTPMAVLCIPAAGAVPWKNGGSAERG